MRIYEWDGISWNKRGTDIGGEASGDESGLSVSLSSDGDIVAIGAPLNDGNGKESGHVRVYHVGSGPKGRVFYDLNSNLVFDSDDVGTEGAYVESDGKEFRSNMNGSFITFKYDLSTGKELKVKEVPMGWKVVDSAPKSYILTGDHLSGVSAIDFPLQIDKLLTNVKVDITHGITRCNSDVFYSINYENIGTESTSGEIIFTYDTSVMTVTSTVPVATSTDDSGILRFAISDLNILESGKINLTATMAGVEKMDSAVVTVANFITTTIDADFSDNVFIDNDVVRCAYDPNDTTYLDMSTFHPMVASHDVNLKIEGNILSYEFNNIRLPDSLTDLVGSQGYFKFSIEPKKALAEYTEINNKAYIYFDFNLPIITNDTRTTLVNPTPALTVGTFTICEGTKIGVIGEGVKWYSDETLQTLLIESDSIIPPSDETDTLYVTQKMNGHESAGVAVIMIINPKPDMPVFDNTDMYFCSDEEIVLSTTGTNIKWYSDVFLTDEVHNGEEYKPIVDDQVTFYVTQESAEGCLSDIAIVNVNINDPFTAEVLLTGTVGELTASIDGDTYQWFKNGEEIIGAIEKTYVITDDAFDANYSVLITKGACETLTEEINYLVNSTKVEASFDMKLYPNPTTNYITLELSNVSVEKIELELVR